MSEEVREWRKARLAYHQAHYRCVKEWEDMCDSLVSESKLGDTLTRLVEEFQGKPNEEYTDEGYTDARS